MEENPVATSTSTLFSARVEFQHFVEQVTLPHATTLGEAFAFHKFPRDDNALQFNFAGTAAAEKGPTLLYRLAPTGEVVTLILPGKSAVHEAGEDCIVLRASLCTSYQLRMRLARDLRDFAASLETTSTARELYDRMVLLHPDRVNPGSLWGAAKASKPS